MAIPSQGAIHTEGRAKGPEVVLPVKLRKRFEEVPFIRGVSRELFRSDRIIDEGQEAQESGSHVIQIGDNGDSRGASPGGRDAGRGRIVTVNVQEARGGHPDSLEKAWRDGQAPVANPCDGAFARTGIDEDEGELAQAARNVDQVRVNSSTPKFAPMNLCGWIIANDSDVVGSKPPSLAGN
jgi:hypothetical protein